MRALLPSLLAADFYQLKDQIEELEKMVSILCTWILWMEKMCQALVLECRYFQLSASTQSYSLMFI